MPALPIIILDKKVIAGNTVSYPPVKDLYSLWSFASYLAMTASYLTITVFDSYRGYVLYKFDTPKLKEQ
jgi:hypothetical protein